MTDFSDMKPTADFIDECVELFRNRARHRRIQAFYANVCNAAPSDFDISDGRVLYDSNLNQGNGKAIFELMHCNAEECEKILEKDILRPPPGTAWARVRTNFSLPEDFKQEFYVPYLGEGDDDMDKSSSLAKEIMEEDNRKADEKEKAGQWFQSTPYRDVLGKDVREQADDSDAENELFDHTKDRSKECYARGAWDRAFKREAVYGTINIFGPKKFYDCVTLLSKKLKIPEEHVCRYYANACYRAYKWYQSDTHDAIMRKHREDLREWIRNETRTDTKLIIESNSVGFFYCRRCNMHDCDLHGVGVDLTPRIIPFDGARKECLEQHKRREIEQDCEFAGTRDCHMFGERQRRMPTNGNVPFGNGMGNGHVAGGNGIVLENGNSIVGNTNGVGNGHVATGNGMWNGGVVVGNGNGIGNDHVVGVQMNGHSNGIGNGLASNHYSNGITVNGYSNVKSEQNGRGIGFVPGEVIDLCSSDDEEPPNSTRNIFREDEGAALLLDVFLKVLGADYCRLAFAVNAAGVYQVTCTEVGTFLSEDKGERLSPNVVRPPPMRKPPKYSKSKTMRLISVKENQVMMHGKRLDYTPCDHEGPCTKENGCTCIKAGLFCEKYCRCCSPRVSGNITHPGNWCSNIFPFCKCKPGHCKTESCDCVVAKRECDPDHCGCHSCTDKKFALGDSKRCYNSSLRDNDITRIVCGHSAVHGWGVYACAPIKKGALIGQYTGEIIRDTDGERRGRVYDQKNLSFLFNITPDWVVDSTRLGNKLRYVNHSRNNNCVAKITRVDGDVFVGIFAEKNIQAWEELLFNYGYGESGPEFARNGGKAKRTKLNSAAMKTSRRREVKSDEDNDDVMDMSDDNSESMEDEYPDDADDEDFCPGQ